MSEVEDHARNSTKIDDILRKVNPAGFYSYASGMSGFVYTASNMNLYYLCG